MQQLWKILFITLKTKNCAVPRQANGSRREGWTRSWINERIYFMYPLYRFIHGIL